ncbi:restriction endonuclease subunit S [Vibrio vulnificus]|uniref:restriction endonuclease subunit S n=1 Tax=Vibrio vulnificus TaxID=672 RepID=UPI00071F2115|nr:restriction endonuclease subunit S [Vibrio vulnificus]ALM71065.1 Type I restriction-modification system, specificity subunit S [Vibrio vulnificus]ANH63134.1 Type I restriction-modification system, specificity subunit S [Vibrio vulnificus]
MSWPTVSLSSVATINPRCPKDIDENQLVSFVAMASASEEGILLQEEIRVLGETKKGFTYFEKEDVLLAKITPCFENGKSLRPFQISKQVGFGSTEFHVVRADEKKLLPQYLFYLLWSKAFRFAGEHAMSGAAGQKRVGTDFLKNLEIPLPPLDEQKRIAAILDKADAIRQKRKQAIALADEFLRSVFLEMFGDPVTNPKGWKKRELGQLLSSIDSGKSPKCESREAAEREWGVLKLSAVTYGEYRSCENKAFLGDPALIEKYEVKNGDLLFTRKNTHKLVAAVSYVFETEEKRAIPDLIFRLNVRDEESLDKLYLFSLLAYPSQRKEIQALAGGAAGSMPNISKANLSLVQIPIPPIELQRKFAEVVNAYRKVFAKLTMHSEIEGLFDSLSQKAFSGQL